MQRKGMTLVELLAIVVVGTGVVLLLLSFFSRTTHCGGTLGTCSANLNSLLKSMDDYSRDHNDQYPYDPRGQTEALAEFAKEIGIKGEMFVCPATDDEPLDLDSVNPADNYSYSYQAPYQGTGAGITTDTTMDVIFLADKAPEISKLGFDWSALDLGKEAKDDSRAMAAMSQNHLDGEIMNVASRAGSLTVRRADVGRLFDNIFTYGGPAGPSQSSTDATGRKIDHRDDSFLLRTDQ